MNNVFVAGQDSANGQGFNVWVRKYDSSGGTLWTQGYNNVSNNNDAALAVACDKSGNAIVTGFETQANMFRDVWTRKYSPAGNALWTQGYDGSAGGDDWGRGIATDANGFVYVAGRELTSNQGVDGWLRKYEP